MFQPEKVLELPQDIKCSSCNNYLSVPPISIFSGGYVCGRCIPDEKNVVIHASAYESLAKFFKFPCKNSALGCKFQYNFGHNHESKCDYNGITCFADKCFTNLTPKTLLEHFQRFHPDSVTKANTFNITQNKDTVSRRILILDQKPFILQIQTNKGHDCSFHLSTIDSKLCQLNYSVEVISDSKNSLTLNQQKISKYYPLVNTEDTLVKFNIDMIKNVLNCLNYYFKISLIEKPKPPSPVPQPSPKCQPPAEPEKLSKRQRKKKNKENQQQQQSQQGAAKAVAKPVKQEVKKPQPPPPTKSTNIEKLVPPAASEAILHNIECIVCNEYMAPPIYACISGHSICSVCHTKLTKCPICQSEYKGTRNFNLENLAETLTQFCKNKSFGCPFFGNITTMRKHNKTCKLVKCPLKCNQNVLMTTIREHINKNHHETQWLIINTETTRNLKSAKTFDCFLTKLQGKFFKICIDHGVGSLFSVHVEDISLDGSQQPKYKFVLEFIDKSSTGRILITSGICHAPSDGSPLNHCLLLPDYLLKPFLEQNGVIHYKIDIRNI